MWRVAAKTRRNASETEPNRRRFSGGKRLGAIEGRPDPNRFPGYAWLEHAEFDPSEGIMLQFGGRKVRITGRNLNAEARPNVRLFAAIVRHRVPWIHEADEPTALAAPRTAIVIEGIDVK